jgi:hypothetical protein
MCSQLNHYSTVAPCAKRCICRQRLTAGKKERAGKYDIFRKQIISLFHFLNFHFQIIEKNEINVLESR